MWLSRNRWRPHIPDSRRFDFNGPANATAAGFIGVRGSETFSPATGYGWTSPAGEYERGFAAGTPEELLRDGAYSTNTGPLTFQVSVAAGEVSPPEFTSTATSAPLLPNPNSLATRPLLSKWATRAIDTCDWLRSSPSLAIASSVA